MIGYSSARIQFLSLASVVILVSLAYLASGCTSSRSTTTEGVQPTWASIQTEVFNKSCATSGCHDGVSKRGNLDLEASASYQALVGVNPKHASTNNTDLKRVVPGNPDKSFLLIKLVAPGPTQGKRMPIGGEPPLDEATIGAIRTWIANGAKQE